MSTRRYITSWRIPEQKIAWLDLPRPVGITPRTRSRRGGGGPTGGLRAAGLGVVNGYHHKPWWAPGPTMLRLIKANRPMRPVLTTAQLTLVCLVGDVVIELRSVFLQDSSRPLTPAGPTTTRGFSLQVKLFDNFVSDHQKPWAREINLGSQRTSA